MSDHIFLWERITEGWGWVEAQNVVMMYFKQQQELVNEWGKDVTEKADLSLDWPADLHVKHNQWSWAVWASDQHLGTASKYGA